MRRGLIARADSGGLATMTREIHRHLQPTATVVMDLGALGRGRTHPEWYDGAVMVNVGVDLQHQAIEWLCEQVDIIYTAEVPYSVELFAQAEWHDTEVALHVMPELWRDSYAGADRLFYPTPWHTDDLPAEATHLPVPVALDRFAHRRRSEAFRFLHIAAPAMEDRNGTQLVIDALPFVTERCEVVIRVPPGAKVPGRGDTGKASVVIDTTEHEHYWENYRSDIDVLLLPRRYGGLSLPMSEAMACGIPVVSLDLEPQRRWLHEDLLVPAQVGRVAQMAGGIFPVHTADPAALGALVSRLVADPDLVADASVEADIWAAANSWEALLPQWRSALSDQ